MELVIATENLHKTREIKSILKQRFPGVDLYTILDFNYKAPEEIGSTFEENAVRKAVHAAQALGRWVLADDSGLVVPALGGEPGVFSSRYAGVGATDKENRRLLLKRMQGLKEMDRSAYFSCTIAVASPIRLEKTVTSICEGTILEEERGHQGFGYDPLFLKYDYSKTFAEISEDLKNQVSHRGKALRAIIFYFETLFQESEAMTEGR